MPRAACRPYDGAVLELVEKREDELAHWIPAMIASYVEDRIHAGDSREAAWSAAEEQFDRLIPNGRPTDGQHVMNVVADGEAVGVLWMSRPVDERDDTWSVFFVEIDERHRGRGLGRAAMLEAEAWALARGGQRITLSVIGPNAVARALYDSLGYEVQVTTLAKELDEPEGTGTGSATSHGAAASRGGVR